nr:MAG TPA: hypothetical protein [Caudoviricetes sp.]
MGVFLKEKGGGRHVTKVVITISKKRKQFAFILKHGSYFAWDSLCYKGHANRVKRKRNNRRYKSKIKTTLDRMMREELSDYYSN